MAKNHHTTKKQIEEHMGINKGQINTCASIGDAKEMFTYRGVRVPIPVGAFSAPIRPRVFPQPKACCMLRKT